MPFLYQIKPDGAVVQGWAVGDRPLVVGRGPEADLRVPDPRLSRAHFVVVSETGGFVLRDLDSTNGTWVNGQRIASRRLGDTDRIRAGRTRFVFESGLATALDALHHSRAGDTQLVS